MSVPKLFFFVLGWKDQFCVKLSRTSLSPISVTKRDHKNKFSVIQTNMSCIFLWFNSRSHSSKYLRMLKAFTLPFLWTYISLLHYLNSFVWPAVEYCITWKLFALIFLIIYVFELCYIILCIFWPREQKKIICWFKCNSNTGTRIIMAAYWHHPNPAQYFLKQASIRGRTIAKS